MSNPSDTATKIIEYCSARGIMLGVAESLTGGLVTATLVEVAGCSAVLQEGVVTYSNASKVKRLGVKVSTLEAVGAVSEEVAMQMVDGLLRTENVSIGLSTTGIAGPTGGSELKPVGLAYIAVGSGERQQVYGEVYTGTRNEIRQKVVNKAIEVLYDFIINNY